MMYDRTTFAVPEALSDTDHGPGVVTATGKTASVSMTLLFRPGVSLQG
jgi:hypothetical protein